MRLQLDAVLAMRQALAESMQSTPRSPSGSSLFQCERKTEADTIGYEGRKTLIRNCLSHGQQGQTGNAMKELRGLYGMSLPPV